MGSTMIYSGSLSMEDSHLRPTICSLETTLTEESSPSKQFAYFLLTKSSILRTSSYSEGTTNVQASTESMASMTSASDDTTLSYGKRSQTASIACQLLP